MQFYNVEPYWPLQAKASLLGTQPNQKLSDEWRHSATGEP